MYTKYTCSRELQGVVFKAREPGTRNLKGPHLQGVHHRLLGNAVASETGSSLLSLLRSCIRDLRFRLYGFRRVEAEAERS